MNERILFVDDEPDYERLIRQKYRKRARAGTIAFDFASNGREALEKLREQDDFAVVLTDINMPEMDGLTLLAEIKKMERHPPVIIVSAYGDMENIRFAMNLGAFDFLLKPIDFKDMDITRRKALDHAAQIRERYRLQEEKRCLESHNTFIRETFGRYVDEGVVQTLLDSPTGLQLGGERRSVTILMSDLRGFSPLTEYWDPEQIVTILNRYYSTMIDIVTGYGGMINELLGDAMLVIFGTPLAQDDDAERAAATALAMQNAMEAVNEQNIADGLPAIEMGIGINSGEVVVGNIGSQKRAKYGVVGSHVNLTARIESYSVGGQVLISEHALARSGEPLEVTDEIEFSAKGFKEPIKVYDLRGIGGKYDLHLPKREFKLTPLSKAIRLRYATFTDGLESFADGGLVKLSRRGAEIRAENTLDLAQSVKLRIQEDSVSGSDLYGKVISRSVDHFVLYFTSVPPEMERLFDELLSGDR